MMIQDKMTKLISPNFYTRIRVLCLVSLFSIIQGMSLNVVAAPQNELQSIRTWPSPDNTRIVLDLSQKPRYETHYLTNPDRLVIDLRDTRNKANLSFKPKKGTIINNIRQSPTTPSSTFRLVVDLKQASKANIFSLPPAKPYGDRLVIDLPSARTKVPERIAAAPSGRDIIIAIDAGHGGDDPGALGKYTYEKKVTLEIAKRLKAKIDAQKGMRAFLIRTGDYFVNLNKRSDIARKGKADFLVSIHADGFTSSQPRGASVWVLSNRRATTELGRWMEKQEAHSELLGGAGNIIQGSDSVPFLNQMLLDMSMGNTMGVGFTIGSLVTKELSRVTYMHKKEPVHASLAVLKSPDIPSILVEAGFITNRTEERLLNQADFQNKIATAVYKGIYQHFSVKPPQGSLFAQKKTAIKHTVRSGESLSTISRRYSVSSQTLKSFNRLKSNSLRVGQVLSIPDNYRVIKEVEPEIRPSVVADATPLQTVKVHTVARGESLSVIADKYNQSTEQLIAHNNLRSTSLAVGQKINIPGATAAVITQTKSEPQKSEVLTTVNVHKVKSGESLSLIASQYNQSLNTLKDYNNLKSTSLQVGQKINIPGTVTVAETQSVAQEITEKVIAPVQQEQQVHVVKSGESLSIISQRYDTTIAQIKADNKLKSSVLFVGQKLKVAGSGSNAVKQRTEEVYTVKSGDSLSVIANRYQTTMATLTEYNQLKSSSVFVGQKIKIPSSDNATSSTAAKVEEPTEHKVASGESLSVIAESYGRSTEQFKAFNKLSSSTLLVGQVLKIPSDNYEVPVRPSSHTVTSGQSLSVIAQQYDTTPQQLMLFNHLKSSSLTVGQVLKIPAENVEQMEHKVRSGESLSVIAQRYGTTTKAIVSTNKLSTKSLTVGQILTIPIS
jgi:N-acetylmuramoyl-L-alanine amidase